MQTKTGKHSIGGIILIILSVAVSVICTLLFGVVGGGVAALLAIIAILLAVRCMKKGGKGKGVVIVGVVAILLAALMSAMMVTTFRSMQKSAENYGDVPLVAKYLDNPYLGVSGIIINASRDGDVDIDELRAQLERMNDHIKAESESKGK